MSSRAGRKDRPSQSGQTLGTTGSGGSEEVQLWHQVRSQLRILEKARSQAKALEDDIEETKVELESTLHTNVADEQIEAKRQALRSALATLKTKTIEEQQAADKALESLGILAALRTASSDETSGDMLKRKRRRVGSSPGPTPSPVPRGPSPSTARGGASGSHRERTPSPDAASYTGGSARPTAKRNNSTSTGTAVKLEKPPTARRNTNTSKEKDAAAAAAAAAAASASATTTTTSTAAASSSSSYEKMDPARARREALAHQLPLGKGRRVAFRQPSKTKSGTSSLATQTAFGGSGGGQTITGDEEGETWIMAVITECINNDRNRYVVQDVEDPNTPTFNTTLKAIVPLPEAPGTLPERDYPPGAQVMALYPDTSCFYRAIVKGGGPKIDNLSKKQKEKRHQELLNAKYQLEFDDDGGDIKLVPAYLVVERP